MKQESPGESAWIAKLLQNKTPKEICKIFGSRYLLAIVVAIVAWILMS